MLENHPLYRIMHPRSVAIAGASNDFSKMGTIQLMNLLDGQYPGKIYPLHPREKTVFGLKAYRSGQDLPEPADLAILTIPTAAVPEVLQDLGERGVRRAIVISGGFKEVGARGKELEARILRIARHYGIRFLGPNCIGVIHPSFRLNPTMYPYRHRFGGVGIASQSGTYVTQIIPYLEKRQIGLSQAFSVGNGADLDLVDCLEYLAEDPETKAIALYIEGLKRPRDFIRAASLASGVKPVVALYVGGTEAGSRSAASHTGSISGPDHLYDALFRQSGVIRALTVEDLFEWAGALSFQPIPRGRNMAILTHSGGPASSLADACNRLGLNVPLFPERLQQRIRELLPATGSCRNPVDLTFFMDMGVMVEKLPRIILENPEIDGLLIHGVMGSTFLRTVSETARKWVPVPDYERVRDFFQGSMEAFIGLPRQYGKPVIASSFADHEDDAVKMAQDGGIPCLRAPERAVSVMAALCRYGEIRARRETRPAGPG